VIITCVSLNLLNNNSSIKNLDNSVLYNNTADPIHPSSHPSDLHETQEQRSHCSPSYSTTSNLETQKQRKSWICTPTSLWLPGVSGI